MTTRRQSHALSRDELVHVITPTGGYATFDGTTNSFIDTALIGLNDFITGKQIMIMSGPSAYESIVALSFNPATGEIVVDGNYSHLITAGTEYRVLNLGGGLTPSQALILVAIAAQVANLAGQAPVEDVANQTWFTAESDIVTFGAAGVKYKVNDFSLSIANLVGTVITIRMYKNINGTPQKFYEETFDATVDPPGIDLITGIVAIHDVLRITLQSNNPADDGKDVDYDYMLEAQ
jgi:hypothetical protein